MVSDPDHHILQVKEHYLANNIERLNKTWFGVSRRSDSSEHEVIEWLKTICGFDLKVMVRHLSPLLFWIVFATEEDSRRVCSGGPFFENEPLRRIDRWAESMGPGMVVEWVRIYGVPLYAWQKESVVEARGDDWVSGRN